MHRFWLLHAVFIAVHTRFAQQGCPAPPHWRHRLLVQIVLPWHVPVQHGSPAVPQLAHAPLVQLPRFMPHDWLAPTHMPPTQQPWGGFMAMFTDPDGNVFYLDQLRDE